jgi:hypothetical protein
LDEAGDERGEEREAEVLADEAGVVRKEGRVEGVLDAGDVEAAVFGEGMVAVDREGAGGESAEQESPCGARPLFRKWFQRNRHPR